MKDKRMKPISELNEYTNKYTALTSLSQGDYDAFLYDCDGTLADSMPGHRLAYVDVASRSGIKLNPDIIDELAGVPIIQVVEEINRRYASQLDPIAFAALQEELFINEFIEQLKPIAFVIEHLKAHHGKKRIAVVSGGTRKTVEKTLAILGISHLPELLVCAGETKQGKPFADPYLAAAHGLGVPPERCLVFEDAQAGILAAQRAGMQWIRVDKIEG